jgi:hypothetical protein
MLARKVKINRLGYDISMMSSTVVPQRWEDSVTRIICLCGFYKRTKKVSAFTREPEDIFGEEPAKSHREKASFYLYVKFHDQGIGWETKMRKEEDVECI